MSLGSQLTAVAQALDIEAAPGVMVFARSSQVVAADPVGQRHIVLDDLIQDDVDRVILELEQRGVLRHASPAGGWAKQHSDGTHWFVTSSIADAVTAIEKSMPVAFATGEDALYLPAGQPELSELLLDRFLATLADPLPGCFSAVASGEMELVFCRPVEGVLRLLAAGSPSVTGAACYRAPATWEEVGTALTGRLRPATNVTVAERGRMKVVSARSAPRLRTASSPAMFGGAVSLSAADAEMRAVAEAYERHVAGIVPRDLVFRSCGSEREDCISPDLFVKYNDEQHSRFHDLCPYDPDGPRVWVRANFATGQPCAVLADLVFYPFGPAGAARHTPANSNGMAAGRSLSQATVAAWQELVERDAFMRTWLGRQHRPRIAWGSDRVVSHIYKELRSLGWDLELFHIGQLPGEAVVLALAMQAGRLALGCAAGNQPTAVVRKAAREAWTGVVLSPPEEAPSPADVRNPSDHRRLYRWGNYGAQLQFLVDGPDPVPTRSLEPVRPIADEAVVFAWPEWTSAPFAMARVLHAPLVPITFGADREPLGRLDVQEAVACRKDLPLFPHPFP
jgi:hypothetical protein